MKLFIKFALLAVLLSTVFGCVTSDENFEVRLTPPGDFNPVFMTYKELPGEKAIMVAVDPGGRWAFGFDHSQSSVEEAVKIATEKCNSARKNHDVFTEAKVFAINDEVIYYDHLK